MDDGKMRAFICKQAAKRAKKQLEGVVPPTKGTAQAKPFIKWKLMDKGDRPPKKLKEVAAITNRETPVATQVPPPVHHGVGKGLMTAKGLVLEQCPPFLRKDPRYVMGLLSSIIKDDDYKDFGNHATEAMGELSLFGLA